MGSCGGMESLLSDDVSLLISWDSSSDVDALVDADVVTESSLKRWERPGVDNTVEMFTLFMSDS
jgi:hypothetical protein